MVLQMIKEKNTVTSEFDDADQHRRLNKHTKNYSLRRLLLFMASKFSSFRSSTLFRNSTFSKYPPPLLLASNSSLMDDPACCSVWMCRCQSIADLSRVVSFFALVGPGRGARAVFGLRGPGLFVGGLETPDGPKPDDVEVAEVSTMGFEDGEVVDPIPIGPGVGVIWACSVKVAIVGAVVETFTFSSDCTAGPFHKGHFFASVESSGTSITFLKKSNHHQ
jgi:hypothetical protein